MSNEVKVGILAIVAIALSYWGYKFIMGKNVLLKSNIYKVYYPRVDRMQVGTNVYINGIEVGSVANLRLLPDDAQNVEVILDIEPGVRLPKDTRAVLVSTGFMGGKAIKLEYDRPCSGDDCLDKGATLKGEYRDLLGSMVGTPEDMEEYIDPIQQSLEELLNSQLGYESETPLGRSVQELEVVLSNLTTTTARLNGLLASSSDNINGTFENLEAITGNLEKNREKIDNILAGTEAFTTQLGAVDLKQTLEEVNATVAGLQATLASADLAMAGVTQTVDRLNAGEGTLGKLLQDEALYRNLNDMTTRADSLFNDLQERPYRYVPFKGRKKVKKYDRKDAALEEGQ